jgi:erythromycin esterase-like protein
MRRGTERLIPTLRSAACGLEGTTADFDALLGAVGDARLVLLDLRQPNEAVAALAVPRLERAIGVIYRPETERLSHYFAAVLARQFDAVLHYDHTRAVEPLERTPVWERGEPELLETYPSAL